jgi:hypothetical protein
MPDAEKLQIDRAVRPVIASVFKVIIVISSKWPAGSSQPVRVVEAAPWRSPRLHDQRMTQRHRKRCDVRHRLTVCSGSRSALTRCKVDGTSPPGACLRRAVRLAAGVSPGDEET